MNNATAIIFGYDTKAEAAIAAAARISTTEGSAIDLYDQALEKDNSGLIRKVIGLGHVTTTEHAVFNIAFDDVSMLFEQFLIEHRLPAYTIKSRRYVDYTDMGAVMPTLRFKESVSADVIKTCCDRLADRYEGLFAKYIQLVDLGIPKEDARFVLPYAIRSHIIMTVNARELMHIIYTLLKGRGSKYPEFREIGEQLYTQASILLPDVFEKYLSVEKGTEDKEKLFGMLVDKIPMNQEEKVPAPLVSVVTHTPKPDKLLPLLAIMNHTGCTPDTAMDYLRDNTEAQDKAIHYLTRDRRKRELEQMHVTFRINSITLSSLTHLTRHRIQNLIVPSFTEMGKSEDFILPPSVGNNDKALEIYQAAFKEGMEIYLELEKAGVVPEDLAYIYQGGNLTSVITTMNGRELMHFSRLRCCNRAQWEIQGIANLMLGACRKISPAIFNNVGPACFMDGSCPEGKMSCGQMKEVKGMYQ